jgi:hypothetical protein
VAHQAALHCDHADQPPALQTHRSNHGSAEGGKAVETEFERNGSSRHERGGVRLRTRRKGVPLTGTGQSASVQLCTAQRHGPIEFANNTN